MTDPDTLEAAVVNSTDGAMTAVSVATGQRIRAVHTVEQGFGTVNAERAVTEVETSTVDLADATIASGALAAWLAYWRSS